MPTQFNAFEVSVALDFNTVCTTKPTANSSAIDEFYDVQKRVIVLAASPPFSTNLEVRHLLVLQLCSAVETYFRRIFAEVMAICPIAKELASGQMVAYGAVAALGAADLGIAISDTRGISSVGEIKSRTEKLLGIPIKQGSSVAAAIELFEAVAQLRHAIVHSSNELLFNNRRELSIKVPGRIMEAVGDVDFQLVVQALVNVVRAYNNHLANELLVRWFTKGVLTRKWQSDKAKAQKLIRLFASNVDSMPADSPKELYDALKALIPA
jgi:hypothetical protein